MGNVCAYGLCIWALVCTQHCLASSSLAVLRRGSNHVGGLGLVKALALKPFFFSGRPGCGHAFVIIIPVFIPLRISLLYLGRAYSRTQKMCPTSSDLVNQKIAFSQARQQINLPRIRLSKKASGGSRGGLWLLHHFIFLLTN